jgi:N-acetylglutamate synthase-like GNAT family acetyltransferase
MKIRKANKKDFSACIQIAKDLTEWFDEKEIVEISKDVEKLPTFVVEDSRVLAFVCINIKSEKVIEIKHFAVEKNHQRGGFGTRLLAYIENQYPKMELMIVKTLDESVDYKPYEQTRAFYEKNGFIKIDVIDPYPGWTSNNSCAIYVKKKLP